MRTLVLSLVVVGCGGPGGEPIEGDITMQYGGDSPDMKVGTVVQDENDPNSMLVQIGTQGVGCDTYLDVFFSFDVPHGTFLYFSVDKAPGTYTGTFVSAMRSTGNSIKINSAQGDVTIDAVEPRVTGSVTFSTDDDEVGTISASGSFDVLRCF